MGLGQKSRKPEEPAAAANAVTAIDSQLKKSSSRKMKCKCPLESPFHWKEDKSPSIFAKDNGALLSMRQTEVVETARKNGRDIGHIPGNYLNAVGAEI